MSAYYPYAVLVVLYNIAAICDEEMEPLEFPEIKGSRPFMAQFNLSAKLFESDDSFVALGGMVGSSASQPNPFWINYTASYVYAGPSIHIFKKFFFVEIGYAFAKYTKSDVNFRTMTYQVGFMIDLH